MKESNSKKSLATTPIKPETFKLGDLVIWESQSHGNGKTKFGKIIEVVPTGRRPKSALRSPGGPRNHESYVVEVQGGTRKNTLYWPVASGLALKLNTSKLPDWV